MPSEIRPWKGALSDETRFEVVRDALAGKTLREIGQQLQVSHETIRRCLEGTKDEDIVTAKKAMAKVKYGLAYMADHIIRDRLENCPERISTGELTVISGVMTQRANELHEGGNYTEPDWTKYENFRL